MAYRPIFEVIGHLFTKKKYETVVSFLAKTISHKKLRRDWSSVGILENGLFFRILLYKLYLTLCYKTHFDVEVVNLPLFSFNEVLKMNPLSTLQDTAVIMYSLYAIEASSKSLKNKMLHNHTKF